MSFLIEELTEITALVKSDGSQAHNSARTTQKMLLEIGAQRRESGEGDESIVGKTQANSRYGAKYFRRTFAVSRCGKSIRRKSALGTTGNAGKFKVRLAICAVKFRKRFKRIQSLSVRSQEIGKIAKQSEDLSQRLNLIAINASIQTGEPSAGNGHNSGLISEEIERIATRAENIGKQISVINKTILSEFGETENSLLATINEAAGLSKLTIETGSALDEIEKYTARILNLQDKIFTYSKEQTKESEAAFKTFVLGIPETENSLVHLKDLANNAAKISDVLEDLQVLVEDLKIPSVVAENSVAGFKLFCRRSEIFSLKRAGAIIYAANHIFPEFLNQIRFVSGNRLSGCRAVLLVRRAVWRRK